MSTLSIGLLGFGCVGQGLYQLLQATSVPGIHISRIAVRDGSKLRAAPTALFTDDAYSVVRDPGIHLVVEAIDDAEAAYLLVREALESGKPVVSANKKMVARHLEELSAIAEQHKVPFLYEASVCGAIPVVQLLDRYFSHEPIRSVSGIFNGTSNFILSKIFNEGLDYHRALRQAQELGFAESDPSSDVGGADPTYKLIILARHAFGVSLKPQDILTVGIDSLNEEDIRFARSRGWKIRLVPSLQAEKGQFYAYVLPRFVPPTERLFGIEHESNAVYIDAPLAGSQFLTGKGAGAFPTATALLSDIRAAREGQRYLDARSKAFVPLADESSLLLEVYLRYTDPSVKSALAFHSITEGFLDSDLQYVVGYTSLASLRRNQQLVRQDEGSLIATGNFRFSRPAEMRSAKRHWEPLSR